MRFVITGTGRSGTMFLANALARSRKYIVRHEHADDHRGWFTNPGSYDRAGHLKLTQSRFRRHDAYGEVNSFLRFIVPDMAVDKRAVVIRNPVDVVLSSINKFPIRWFGMNGFDERIAALGADYRQIQKLIDANYPIWRFERFTREQPVMAEILDWLDIDDVDPYEVKYGDKVNASGRQTIRDLAQLSPAHRKMVRAELRWFADEHYPGTWSV